MISKNYYKMKAKITIKNIVFLWSLLFSISTFAQFSQQSKIVSPDRGSRDEYGTAVDIRDDFAVSGTPRYNIAAGAAYIYAKDSNGEWSHHETLIPDDSKEMAEYGGGVKMTDDYIVVASGRADIGSTIRAGALYVYDKNGVTWDFNTKIVASDYSNDAKLGMNPTSIDAEGETIVSGAPAENGWIGSVYVFERVAGTWTEAQKIENPANTNDTFGIAVALSGNIMVIGANESNGLRGSAYVYYKESSGVWTLNQQITAADSNPEDFFGSSVSIDGETIAVGAYGASGVRGAAYLFKRDSSGAWQEVQKVMASVPVSDANFGFQCEVKGKNLIVGAPHAWASTEGEVFWFQENAAGQWELKQLIQSEDIKVADFFGWSVALYKDQLIVGAPWESTDVNGNNPLGEAGSAYIFKDPSLGTVNFSGIKNELNCYPNPLENLLSIKSSFKSITTIKIRDLNGKTIKNIDAVNKMFLTVDTLYFASGVYLLEVDFDDGSRDIQKIVKR